MAGEYLERAGVLGIIWPLSEGVDDGELDGWLFTPVRLRPGRLPGLPRPFGGATDSSGSV
ncbi:hypothetical protein XI00_06740 [Bradyrhizobium sp. CCBAU 21359]|nr:hypothetical protein [Bradyrhizobium sp. CCBAU 21359]